MPEAIVAFLRIVTMAGGVALVFYLVTLWVRWLVRRGSR